MSVLLRERHGEVELLTLNRPERRNALSVELLETLDAALRELAADAALRAVVITGTDPAWCAGVDLVELSQGGRNLHVGGVMEPMRALPVPLIAAVNGACVTGGLELALACDIRIGSERARFADTHARVGVHPGWGLTAALPRVVGTAMARQMSFTGNYVDADAALRCGLITMLVPHASLLDQAMALAGAVASTERSIVDAIRTLYDADEAYAAALRREREGYLRWREDFDGRSVAGRVGAVIARGREQTRG